MFYLSLKLFKYEISLLFLKCDKFNCILWFNKCVVKEILVWVKIKIFFLYDCFVCFE